MSNPKNLPKTIPSKEIPFHFKAKGSVSGQTYEGDFIVKVPSIRETSRMGIELAKLAGEVSHDQLDRLTAAINYAVAYSKVCLLEVPKWFSDEEDKGGMEYGLATLDLNVVLEIFNQAKTAVDKWKADLNG